MYTTIKCCRICKNKNLKSVFNLGNQYLTGTFPKSKKEKVNYGPVELVKCTEKKGKLSKKVCGLVQLKQTFDLNYMYGMNYGYRSGLNKSMVKHLKNKVKNILNFKILKPNDLVIDIGSNDATTLLSYPKKKFQLIGIDPTGVKFSEYYPKHIKLISDFFSYKKLKKKIQNKKAKVITSFAMFYDLEDPVQFAKEIYQSLDDDGIWCFEQSYLPSMLKANSFDTICHEHLEFYYLKQIIWIADKANLKIVDVELNDVNGGSFSVIVAKKNSVIKINKKSINSLLKLEKKLKLENFSTYKKFKKNVELAKKNLINFLKKQKINGKKVYGLGASTKGNVLLQYFNIKEDLLKYIGEVNQDKLNSFTPGTYIPMISENEAIKLKPDYFLILPWHFKSFFINSKKFSGKKLVFPLPFFKIVKVK